MVSTTKSSSSKTYTVHGQGIDETTASKDLERAVNSVENAIGASLAERIKTSWEVTLVKQGRTIATGSDDSYKRALSKAQGLLPTRADKKAVTGQLVTIEGHYRIGAEQPYSTPDPSAGQQGKRSRKAAGGGPDGYQSLEAMTDLF